MTKAYPFLLLGLLLGYQAHSQQQPPTSRPNVAPPPTVRTPLQTSFEEAADTSLSYVRAERLLSASHARTGQTALLLAGQPGKAYFVTSRLLPVAAHEQVHLRLFATYPDRPEPLRQLLLATAAGTTAATAQRQMSEATASKPGFPALELGVALTPGLLRRLGQRPHAALRCLVYDADTVLRASYRVPVTRRARQGWQELRLTADVPAAGFVQVLFGNEGRLPVLADDLTLTLTAPPLAPALVLHGGLASAFAVQETGGCTGHGPHPGDPVSPGMPCGDDPNAPCGSFPLGNVGVTGHHPDPPSHGNPDPPQLDPPEPEPASDPCLDGTGDMCLCDPGSCDPPQTDCAGVVNGGAYLDKCYTCVGGTTGRTACTGCNPTGAHNLSVQDGAPIAAAQQLANMPGFYGFTWPTSVEYHITACQEGGVWKPQALSIRGHYSVQAENPPGVSEVTGPGGSTTKDNFCLQMMDLQPGPYTTTKWWMVSATRAHEAVHEDYLQETLFHATSDLERVLNSLSVPTYEASTEAAAIARILNSSAYINYTSKVLEDWQNFSADYGETVHNNGATRRAEQSVTDPMASAICDHAKATRVRPAGQTTPNPDEWDPTCPVCR